MFQALCTYVGFTAADSERIARLGSLVSPHVPEIVETFYAAILRDEGARAVLEDEAQVVRLKATLQVWLRELLAGPHDEAYYERRTRIGHTHVRVGLPIRYMVTAINVVRQAILGTLRAEPNVEDAQYASLHKILDLDLAIMLQSYAGLREHAARAGARAELQAEFEDIFNNARATIVQLDADGRMLATNREAERLWGVGHGELLGDDFLDHVHPDDRGWMRTVLGAAPGEGAATSMLRCQCISRSGRVRHVDWTLAHMAGEDGPRRVLVGIDVTERVLLQEKARAAERMATIGQMAAVLAHEIRNPLNAATLQLTLLQRIVQADRSAAGGRALQAVSIVRTEIRRLEGLVTDFLGFARPTQLDRSPVSARMLLEELPTLVGEVARERSVRFELDLPDDLPAIDVDPDRMRQVLLNLVNNALDAMSERPGTIVLRASRDGEDAVRLSVLDEGAGIDQKLLERVFEPFFTTKAKGTGLGLAVVRRIVEDHHGTVTMLNREGGGVEVALRLPVARDQ